MSIQAPYIQRQLNTIKLFDIVTLNIALSFMFMFQN
jgi:hypothetical protein